ncbi:MAG: type IV pilus modification protein PilV [Candidatus Thiodiazotropha sp. (ex Gloverina cf. vestifex)]|nr:type IV pilus modification protein PilV [Candidatus Thiodiazotropha sp. (ex Gloverina cf. vestifex)]
MKALNHHAALKIIPNTKGFTLMEVLVTIVILSIGLLGVAGLQFSSLRGNQNALEASSAVALAMEGADRIRANLPGIRNPDTGVANRTNYDLINAAGTDPGCIGTGCSLAQLAQTDAFEWISKIEAQLPGGEGVICRDGTPNDGISATTHACDGAVGPGGADVFAVKIWWDHDRNPATALMGYRMSLIP